jgi:IS5 family transposase
MSFDVAATLSLARTNPAQGSVNTICGTQKQRNRRIATPQARVEHVFGTMRHVEEKLVSCTGIVRATFAFYLETASYNL